MPIASIIRGRRLRRHGEYTGRRVSITGWQLLKMPPGYQMQYRQPAWYTLNN